MYNLHYLFMFIGMCVIREDVRHYLDYCVEGKSVPLKDDQINCNIEISRKEISTTHIRCLWLCEDGPSELASVTETSAKIVVVVNTINSFQVEDWVYDNCSLPVVVLNFVSGQILKDIFDDVSEAQTYATISLTEMQVDIRKSINVLSNLVINRSVISHS